MKSSDCELTRGLMIDLLDDELNDADRISAENHLSDCPKCRASLDAQTAEPEFWDSLIGLKDDEYDLDSATVNEKADVQTGANHCSKFILNSVRGLLAPSDDPLSAGKIGPYEIRSVIGAGGMGIVLKARDNSLDRMVAVKILAPHLAANKIARIRFQRETRAAASVQHNGIIPIFGVDLHRDTPYFVMPLENGPSLQSRIEQSGPLSVEEALRVAVQVADALAAAHDSGLVHRDIKPSNILLAPGTERALLTDFGLAQFIDQPNLTLTGTVAGTPAFMSPEQARGESVDARTDLFSLGSLLYMMLTGRPPIEDESTLVIIRKIASGEIPRLHSDLPSCPTWLDELIHLLHLPEPDQRPESASKVSGLLKQCQQHLKRPAEHTIPPLLAGQRSSPQSWRGPFTKLVFPIIAIGLMTIALILTFTFWQTQPKDRTESESNANIIPTAELSWPMGSDWDRKLSSSMEEIKNEFEQLENEEHWVFDLPIEFRDGKANEIQ